MVTEKFFDFQVARFRFVLKAIDTLFFPPYKGATLRGGFGTTFRRVCCLTKNNSNCNDCAAKPRCAYAYIFETSPFEDSQKLKNLKEIPRPFVIEPPLETKRVYHSGETLEFILVLIGKAIHYLPYFVFTFKELGRIGIGKGRGRYQLIKVYNFDQPLIKIYDAQEDTVNTCCLSIDVASLPTLQLNNHQLSMCFITPTRIKFKKDLVVKPPFHIIIRSLLHRLSALFYFHCGKELNVNYQNLISKAEQIETESSDLKWVDWERYSSRQNNRMRLGGFVGQITYKGSFDIFLPLLLLGQYTHIGKNCTFGLGKYELCGLN